MARRYALIAWFAVAALMGGLPVAAAGEGMRVLSHEPLRKLAASASGDTLRFEAYGRQFDLRLRRNARLHFVDAVRVPGVEVLEGSVDGAPRSWVRLTRTPVGLFGMIFDGNDYYAVEPASSLSKSAVGPLAASGNAPVIFRLKDTLLPPGEASCGTISIHEVLAGRASQTAQQALQALSAGLEMQAAGAPTRQIDIAMLGDFEFSQLSLGGLTPEAVVAARMNVVDGIFSMQVGVRLNVTSVTIFRDAADPFTDTLVPNTLLTEVGTYRTNSAVQRARGLTHLLTGRNLEGSTVGIAYVGALCSRDFGAGLSMANLSATNAALVIAHELGHNFGAFHDGEAGRVCEATLQTFLMAPRINNSDQFSPCSLESIAAALSNASCVTALNVPDASLSLPAGGSRLRGTAFDYTLTVRSSGALTVEGVAVRLNLPASLTINSSSIAGGGGCTAGVSNSLDCPIGSLAAGTDRSITVNLSAQQSGPLTVSAVVSASNDAVASNNGTQTSFTITPSADLDVQLSASPGSFNPGGSTQVTATVRHLDGDAAADARLTVTAPPDVTISAIGANTLGCTLQAGAVSCTTVALASGASGTVALTVGAATLGSRTLNAAITASIGDPVSGNNAAAANIDVVASPASSGGGGGGGALDPIWLALLLLLVALAAARRSGWVSGTAVAKYRR